MLDRARSRMFQVARLIRTFGVIEGARLAAELATRRRTVRFTDRGRSYWMSRDAATVHHLTSSITPLRRLASYVDPRDTRIVDVGAHSGLFATFAAERAPAAHLTLVEPDPTLAPVIQRNLVHHSNWELVQKAVAGETGRISFFRNAASTQTSSLLTSALHGLGGPVTELEVDATTLDDLLVNDEAIDVLKVDVQGAEHLVLRGAANSLKRVRTLLIEVTLLDPDAGEVLMTLREEFGEPERVNPVFAGADLAYRRRTAHPAPARSEDSRA
jgi:FkbM family methyltransferase